MKKTLLALTLILATTFADLADLNLGSLGTTYTLTSGKYTTGSGTSTVPIGLIVDGSVASEGLGTHVSDAGDFNGDDYPDYIITGTKASAFIVFGASSARIASIDLSGTAAQLLTARVVKITISGASTPTNLVVGAAGDNNGDSYDDVIVAWPNYASGKGCAYVIFGRNLPSTGAVLTFDSTPSTGTEITGDDQDNTNNKGYFFISRSTGVTTDLLGTSVARAGDLDDDGYDDVMISAPGADSGLGKVYIIRGKPFVKAITTTTANVRATAVDVKDIDPTAAANKEGYFVAGIDSAKPVGKYVAYAGDVNGDGQDDVIIGSTDYAYLVYGVKRTASTLFASIAMATSTSLVTIIKGPASEGFGNNVGMAGDLNNDGVDDVFVGAPTATVGSGSSAVTAAGKVYVIWGSKTTLSTTVDCSSGTTSLGTRGIILSGVATSDAFGTQSDGVGDVNLDGVDDLVVGAPSTLATTPGKVYVIYGSTSLASLTVSSLTAASSGITITGKSNGDKFGTSVSAAGNLNQDTYKIDDFIVGAPGADTTTTLADGGIVYEFYGIKKTVVTTTTTTGSGFRLGTSLLILASFFGALIF